MFFTDIVDRVLLFKLLQTFSLIQPLINLLFLIFSIRLIKSERFEAIEYNSRWKYTWSEFQLWNTLYIKLYICTDEKTAKIQGEKTRRKAIDETWMRITDIQSCPLDNNAVNVDIAEPCIIQTSGESRRKD